MYALLKSTGFWRYDFRVPDHDTERRIIELVQKGDLKALHEMAYGSRPHGVTTFAPQNDTRPVIQLFKGEGQQPVVVYEKDDEMLREIAMVAACMSHECFNEIYKAQNEGVINTYDLISRWSEEFAYRYRMTNWEAVLNDPTEQGFPPSVTCWDDAIIWFARENIKGLVYIPYKVDKDSMIDHRGRPYSEDDEY